MVLESLEKDQTVEFSGQNVQSLDKAEDEVYQKFGINKDDGYKIYEVLGSGLDFENGAHGM